MGISRLLAALGALTLLNLTGPALADSPKPVTAPGGIGGTGHSGRPDLPEMPDIPAGIEVPVQPELPDLMDGLGTESGTTQVPDAVPTPEITPPGKPEGR